MSDKMVPRSILWLQVLHLSLTYGIPKVSRFSENSKFFHKWNLPTTTITKTPALVLMKPNFTDLKSMLVPAGSLLIVEPLFKIPIVPETAMIYNSKVELKFPIKGSGRKF